MNNEKSPIGCGQSELGTWTDTPGIKGGAEKSRDKERCSGAGEVGRGHGGQAEVSAHQMACPLLALSGEEQKFRWALWLPRGKGLIFL